MLPGDSVGPSPDPSASRGPLGNLYPGRPMATCVDFTVQPEDEGSAVDNSLLFGHWHMLSLILVVL